MILFVDDDYLRLDPWISTLARNGYSCHMVRAPDEAIEFANENPALNAAIVDIMLPVGNYDLKESDGGLLSGMLLIKDIRKMYPNLPIVAFSVRDDIAMDFQGLNVPFISKTFDDPDDLVSELRKMNVSSSSNKPISDER